MTPLNEQLMKRRFILLQISYWLTVASIFSFIASYFSGIQKNEIEIGTYLSIFTLFGAFGQPFFGFISERIRSQRKVLLFLFSAWLLTVLLFFYSSLPYPFLMAMFGFFSISIPPLLDGWILSVYPHHPEKYGQIRSSASLAYAIYIVFFGVLFQRYGNATLPIASSFWIIVSIIATIPKDGESQTNHIESNKALHERNAWKPIVLLLLVAFSMGVVNASVLQLQIFLLQPFDEGAAFLGFTMFVASFVQFPVMYSYRYLKRLTTSGKILLGIAGYTLSFLLLTIAPNRVVYVIGIAINGASFGVFMPAVREFIHYGTTSKTFMLSLVDTIQNSIGGSIGNVIGGYWLYKFGVTSYLQRLLWLSIATMLLYALFSHPFRIKKEV